MAHKVCSASESGPEEWAYDSAEEYVDDAYATNVVSFDYMGLSLEYKMETWGHTIQWTPPADSVAEAKSLFKYAEFLGKGGEAIFEAISNGADIAHNWEFGELLPESEIAAIREAAIAEAERSVEWRW